MSVYKELLLLRRDFGGVVILFIMPLILIFAVTLIQESAFKKISDAKIPILLVDYDNGKVSKSVYNNLEKSDIFNVITQINNKPISEAVAKKAVFKGKYQLAIIIPRKLSSDLQTKIDQNVENILGSFGEADTLAKKQTKKIVGQKTVKLYFDPAVQLSFKNAEIGRAHV